MTTPNPFVNNNEADIITDMARDLAEQKAVADRLSTENMELLIRINDLRSQVLNQMNEFHTAKLAANTVFRQVFTALIEATDIEDAYNAAGFDLPKKIFQVRVPVTANVYFTVEAESEEDALSQIQEGDYTDTINEGISDLSAGWDYTHDLDGAQITEDQGYANGSRNVGNVNLLT